MLDDVLSTLEPPEDDAGVERARALCEVAAHVTGRDDRIGPGDRLAAARVVVDRWQAYWAVYRADFVADAGLDPGRRHGLETALRQVGVRGRHPPLRVQP